VALRLFVDANEAVSDGPSIVAVSIDREDATVADLASALTFSETSLVIDGVAYVGDVPLADVGLVEGAVVAPL